MKYQIISKIRTFTMASVVFMSVLVFAQVVGQEVELLRYMNARYPNPDFRRTVNNIAGQLREGTRGRVVEVKRFSTGNSGFLLNILDGDLRSRTLWVHYNPENPSLRLFTAQGTPTGNGRDAVTGTTTRDIPATADPVLDRNPAAIIPNPAATGVSGTVAPPPPRESPPVAPAAPPAPPPNPAQLPVTIDQANRAVGDMTADGATGCRDCAPDTTTGGSAAPIGPPAPAPQPPPPAGSGDLTNYIIQFDALVTQPGLSAQMRQAHLLMSLRAHMVNYSLMCRFYYPSADDSNLWANKTNDLAPTIRRHTALFPGSTARARLNAYDTIYTAYSNRGNLRFTQMGTGNSAPESCRIARADFLKITRLSEAEIVRFSEMTVQQRRAFLDSKN